MIDMLYSHQSWSSKQKTLIPFTIRMIPGTKNTKKMQKIGMINQKQETQMQCSSISAKIPHFRHAKQNPIRTQKSKSRKER